ncbi:hypothetical protein COLO4_19158 [Corchorus olitorius]|uniref:Uncharacterized protein n=1 Tax=Corchorus olitorius TaxID=93759 RepID=A0A1R3J6M6_9ROSI|nr:hypothetical protein COLO4_19158 [Corchorus olitorius]
MAIGIIEIEQTLDSLTPRAFEESDFTGCD